MSTNDELAGVAGLADLPNTKGGEATIYLPESDYKLLVERATVAEEQIVELKNSVDHYVKRADKKHDDWCTAVAEAAVLKATIAALKRMCHSRDIEIATALGRLQGVKEEQQRVFDLEHPMVQVERKHLLGARADTDGATTWGGPIRQDWLNIEENISVQKQRGY